MRHPVFLDRKYLYAGRFRISSYAVTLYLGFVLGVVLGTFECGLDPTRFAAAALILLVPALIGGRLWYLLSHPDSFGSIKGWQSGGAGLYGGFVLSFALSWPVLRLLDLPFWRFWDGAAVVLLVGMTVTRLGCLMTGCCAGRATRGPLGMWLPDHRGVWRRRYPAQLMEMAWTGAIVSVGLWLHTPDSPPGALFFGAAAAYGIGRVGLELLREEADIKGRPTRLNLVFSISLAASAAVGLSIVLN